MVEFTTPDGDDASLGAVFYGDEPPGEGDDVFRDLWQGDEPTGGAAAPEPDDEPDYGEPDELPSSSEPEPDPEWSLVSGPSGGDNTGLLAGIGVAGIGLVLGLVAVIAGGD